MGAHFGVRELAPAFAEGACSRRVSNRFWAAQTELMAAAASCLTQSASKLAHSKVCAHGGRGWGPALGPVPACQPEVSAHGLCALCSLPAFWHANCCPYHRRGGAPHERRK